jgi:hypothetical protein
VNDYIGAGTPGPIAYQAYLQAWDAATGHATGPALWQSPVLQTPGTDTGAFFPVAFATGGTPVVAGAQYVLYLTTNGLAAPSLGNTAWAFPYADVYAGGAFRFLNDPNFASLTTLTWEDSAAFGLPAGSDLIFAATFDVPEPASAGMLGLALAARGLVRRRRPAGAR